MQHLQHLHSFPPPLPLLVVATTILITTLLLFRKPRVLVDLWNSPPNFFLLITIGPILLPSTVADILRRILCHCTCRKQSVLLSPTDNELISLPAHILAAKIRSGEITSVELTQRCIERIQKCNNQLNAVVCERFADALKDAAAADKSIANQTVKPHQLLFGVPVVVKECFELKGLPFTAGIRAREGLVGQRDSTTMDRIRKDGLIIVGTTNISEGCMFHESNNGVYGLTCNPWDTGRTPGGSSGGCASSVAAGFAPLAVTSDVGGSTRLPAFYQGLFGHKPTGGTVPNTGTVPHVDPDSLISRYCQLGPTSRSSYDLFPLLKTLSGIDGIDKQMRNDVLLNDLPGSVNINSTFTVYNITEPFMPWFARCGLHPELRQAQVRMVETLRVQYGVHVINVDATAELPEMREAFTIWAAMMQEAQDGVVFGDIIENNSCCSLFRHLFLEICTCSLRARKRHTIPAVGLALLDLAGRSLVSKDQNAELLEKGRKLKAALNKMLHNDRCCIICPSVLCPAPRHHENLIRFLSTCQTSIFNVMELPATAVPYVHLSKDGLPLGIQIVGGDRMDHVTIAVANALENAGVAGFPIQHV